MSDKKMVEVPLADGKVGELPEGTLVEPAFGAHHPVESPVYVAKGGYRKCRNSFDVNPWLGLCVVRVFEEVDLPEPKVELPKGVGAVLRSEGNPDFTLTRVGAKRWVDNAGFDVSEDEAEDVLSWSWIYVASEGVDLDG